VIPATAPNLQDICEIPVHSYQVQYEIKDPWLQLQYTALP